MQDEHPTVGRPRGDRVTTMLPGDHHAITTPQGYAPKRLDRPVHGRGDPCGRPVASPGNGDDTMLACHHPQVIKITPRFAIACTGIDIGALVYSVPRHDSGGASW